MTRYAICRWDEGGPGDPCHEPEDGRWVVINGPWWCPNCSRALTSTIHTNHGEPCCPKCGTALEEQGTGDDDPEG